VFHDAGVPAAILNRARADAVRHASAPPAPPPEGLSLFLRLPLAQG
jgi:uroporphyrin-III C-methyltransferase/precorrin-2 dehydrogenase/sirohydrochlorin ferrochelatase